MSVVVTGASNGIGAACVRAFQTAGRTVVGVDAEAASEADEHLVVDLGGEDCGNVVAEALEGRPVEALVNNAAYAFYGPADETEVSTWNETLAVNLRAPFLLAVALHPSLRSAGGSVVNISSVHALATSPGVAAYAASKGGLVAMTRALAVEWAPSVRVNCVLPGAVDTRMLAEGLGRSGSTVEELGRRHPIGRVAEPEDIAETVLFLARAEVMTGAALVADGGATARLGVE